MPRISGDLQTVPWALVVEDDDLAGRSAVRALGRYLEIELATSLAAARARLSRPHLVGALLDIGLPDGDGFELVIPIRARHPQALVRMWSGRRSPEDAARAARLDVGLLLKGRDATAVRQLGLEWQRLSRVTPTPPG